MKPRVSRAKLPPSSAAQVSRTPAASFPVVGIGASAGGLEAVTSLLRSLPAETGMGFVLVQHLDPTHQSALTSLLSRTTQMTVLEAQDGLLVLPDHVYVIPPDKKMGIEQRTLRLLPRESGGELHAPVDCFFRALAADQGGQSIGIVLSGTGADSTHGLEEIKAAGGITFVQDAVSAKYAGMHSNAVASGRADYILPPDVIATELVRVGHHPHLIPDIQAGKDSVLPMNGNDDKQICSLPRNDSGVDFTHHKPATLCRRISRRRSCWRWSM